MAKFVYGQHFDGPNASTSSSHDTTFNNFDASHIKIWFGRGAVVSHCRVRTASNLVLLTGATISAKSRGSTSLSPIVSKPNQQLLPRSMCLASGTTVVLGPIIIAVSGITLGPAATLPISKVWSTSAHIVSCLVTPLVYAQLAHRLLTLIDYPSQLLDFFVNQQVFVCPLVACLRSISLYFHFFAACSCLWFLNVIVWSTFTLSQPLACCCYLSHPLLEISAVTGSGHVCVCWWCVNSINVLKDIKGRGPGRH